MAAPLEQEDDGLLKDDFYSLLNISRDASKDEVNQAYKQLSRIYHPDKHLDPVKKRNAEALFGKLKRAHEILTDEHKRTIYDLYGEQGLENYGKEVISRTKTPAEIIAEYERYQKDLEEERLNKRTNPRTTTVIQVDATDLFDSYDQDDDYEQRRLPYVEVNVMHMNQSVELRLTNQNTVTLSGSVTSENGRGVGNFGGTWKRYFSNRGTLEVESMLGNRNSMTFRYSKALFGRFDTNLYTKLSYRSGAITTSMGAGVRYHFDKHLQGRIRWDLIGPTVNTYLIYNSENYNLVFQVKLNKRESFLSASVTRKFKESDGSVTVDARAGTMGVFCEFAVEKQITEFTTVGASLSVATFLGVNLQLKFVRGQHTLLMPISLSGEVIPSAVFYGTVAPIIVYFSVKKLIVDPFISEQKDREIETRKREQQEKVHERKREAEALIELMKETVERSREAEERKRGLVILKAMYGKLTAEHHGDLDSSDCIDVTIQLQALVKESKLISPEKNTKSFLPGFYDPCIGEEKRLYIKYKFRRKLHHVTLNDLDFIRLPQQRHLIKEEDLPLTMEDEIEDS